MLLFKRDIFIVEDHPAHRLVYRIALGREGANLIFDPLGAAVAQKLKSLAKLDLIILDLTLPGGKSGFEIFREIRTLSHLNSCPVLAVSASETAVVQAQELGFSGFILKPIDYKLLPGQVRQIMAGEVLWFEGNH